MSSLTNDRGELIICDKLTGGLSSGYEGLYAVDDPYSSWTHNLISLFLTMFMWPIQALGSKCFKPLFLVKYCKELTNYG